MSDDALISVGAFVVVWGGLLAISAGRLTALALLYSLAALCAALLALLMGGTAVALENQASVALGVMAVPGLVAAWAAFRAPPADAGRGPA